MLCASLNHATWRQRVQYAAGFCIGLVSEKAGEDFREHGPVVLASGGFGDFTSNSLLALCRPDFMHGPTTNGEHCTEDGTIAALRLVRPLEQSSSIWNGCKFI